MSVTITCRQCGSTRVVLIDREDEKHMCRDCGFTGHDEDFEVVYDGR